MKACHTVLLILVLAAISHSVAEEPQTIEGILEKRISLLSKIYETKVKIYHDTGTISAAEVHDAALDLYRLCRDSAKQPVEAVDWQRKIVAVEEEANALIQTQLASGKATTLDSMQAEERVLAAKQNLLELEARSKK